MATTSARGRTAQRGSAAQAKQQTKQTRTRAAVHEGEAGRTRQAQQRTRQPEQHTATVNLPFVTARFRRPDLHMPNLRIPTPDRDQINAVLHTVRSYLPPPQRALYYGGLALLAAVEVLEWPVAAAIGVGTALASTAQRRGEREAEQRGAGRPQSGQAKESGSQTARSAG